MVIESMMKGYENIFKTNTSRLAVSSVTLSAVATLIIWVVFAGSLNVGGEGYSATISRLGIIPALLISALFLIMFFVIWFILYISYMKEAEDIYSHLRVKLAGPWSRIRL